LSHNNICEKNLFINTKCIWKLNGFELSSSFSNTKKDFILKIKPFKKNNLSPEEETENLDHLDKGHNYTLDVYSWAIMFNELLSRRIIDENDCSYLKNCLDSNPTRRPRIDSALNLNLFKSSKLITSNQNEKNQEQMQLIDEQLKLIAEFNSNEKFNQENESIDKLVVYIRDLSDKLDHNEQNYEFLVNENFINFLLQPIMFFSEKIRQNILPSILIPKTATNGKMSCSFINENKYTAYVVPHILNLFLLKILNVRLVLLDYFHYFIYFIKNNDALRYEILPE
jgi:serine/threonine protein kinase